MAYICSQCRELSLRGKEPEGVELPPTVFPEQRLHQARSSPRVDLLHLDKCRDDLNNFYPFLIIAGSKPLKDRQ